MKSANARMRALELNTVKQRLYVSTFEGQLFIFNVSDARAPPIIMKTFAFGQEYGYVNRMQYIPS